MRTLKTYTNVAEAGFAHSLLEAAGLHPFLADEQVGGLYPAASSTGIRLEIEDAEYEQATRVLTEGLDAERPPGKGPNPQAGMATDPHASGRIPVTVFVAAGVGFLILCYSVGSLLRERDRRGPKGETGEQTQTEDLNNDGKPDQFWYYHHGKLVRREEDRNFDGHIDEWIAYDSNGRMERVEYDDNHDGKPDHFTTYRNGRVFKKEADRNYDGQIDEWAFYGSDGTMERAEYDQNHDGKPDLWEEYRHGRRMAARHDTDFNGVPDTFTTFKEDDTMQTDIRPNDSTIVTRRFFYSNTILREEWVDEDADGKFDYRIEYDPFHKPSGHLPIPEGK